MKKILIALLVSVFIVSALPVCGAFADGPGKGGYGMKGGDSLEGKFCMKAGFILMNEEELGLSAQQVEGIKKLKYNTRRSLIAKNAEIDLAAVDIKEKMWQDKLDVAAISKLIDKKYELKKEKAKMLVQAIADLKGMLSDEQVKTMKSLWKKDKK
jgi:hypothetical protein